MPFRLCSRAPTISIAGSSMRADTAARARAGAEPSSIPARRRGGRGKRDPAVRTVSPAGESRYGSGVDGRAELPHSRVLLGGIVALALAVHLVGIRKERARGVHARGRPDRPVEPPAARAEHSRARARMGTPAAP